MTLLRSCSIVVAVVGSGLMAGLFAAFAYSVMPALGRADASASVAVMQRINTAILNPIFGLIFAGGLIASVLAAALSWSTQLRWWALIAAVCFVLGTLVTLGLNVPLNNQLDAAAPAPGAAPAVWADFATAWVWWNIVRTVAHLAGFVSLVGGLVAAATLE